MKGITFGNLHSYDDLNLILQPGKEIGSPEVKVRKIDIEGADGSLDYTDFFGEPKYEDVTHKFSFATIVPQAQFLSLFSTVKNALHGKKMRIILDDDPLFYYMGRIKVSSFTNEKNVGMISMECDCEPYKYKLAKTVVSRAVTGTQAITLTNGRKRAVPEVTIAAEGSLNIVFQGSNIWDLGSGSYTLPELELVEGVNTVTVTGTGTITFTWQEANL
jgi:phage-related protein